MTTKTKSKDTAVTQVNITAPEFAIAEFALTGNTPYVQLRFGEKAKAQMREKMMAGSQARKGKQREARDFDEDYENALYLSEDGWYGIPASSFRQAAISACRLVGFKMTLAKLSLFVIADGFDAIDGTPLIRIEGVPKPVEHAVRNATGVADLRVRGMWVNWSAKVRMKYDTAQFSPSDISNLMSRVGLQVGIGEGRPDSKNSAGMGWGQFEATPISIR